ncbi:hypothetical protein CARUB_v10007720mg [Capsella rubella]|uniref:Gnk2-homologous domain-containing protein n=1 Tax=Capsella rubella TaxID=81985 RepID=R0H328_9BRAS|nr:cysteine-rich repeat secretory protein 59 [Capsella rubella]EOA19060.1 hypothetical protein CARUB_v10007720mg [Capsella rubella]
MDTPKKLCTLFCFAALFCLFFTINQTMSESDHMDTFCIKSSRNITHNNTNLNTMLSTFRNQSSTVNYYNLTTGLASDTVYGMFLCTGDVNITTCHNCVKDATIEIAKNCTNHREAIIYYMDCMVHSIKKRLSKTMGEVIVRSSMLSSAFTPYYYMDETRFDGSYDIGSLV